MPINVACSACNHKFDAPSKYAGKKVKCPECKEAITIAKPKGGSKSKKIAVKCECGKSFGAKPEWAGKKIKCPGCGKPVSIPKPKSASSAESKSASAKPAQSAMGELFDEIGFNPEDGSARKKCPECRAPMTEEAIICIDCGYNETTGKKMETVRPVTAEDRAKRAAKHDEPSTSGKSGKGGNNKMTLIVGVVVAVAALGGVAVLMMSSGA